MIRRRFDVNNLNHSHKNKNNNNNNNDNNNNNNKNDKNNNNKNNDNKNNKNDNNNNNNIFDSILYMVLMVAPTRMCKCSCLNTVDSRRISNDPHA